MNFESAIRTILADNISGSSRILDNFIETIKHYLQEEPFDHKALKTQMEFLIENTGDFAVMQHFLKKFQSKLLEVHKDYGDGNGNANKRLLEFIDEYQRKWKTPIVEAARALSTEIDFRNKTVLLHSNSSSLHKVFGYLASRQIFPAIYQTLSGPANEGKDQAIVLSDLGFEVRFIHESAAGIFVNEADMLLLGTDKIYKDHFINKIGSLSMALLAKYAGKGLYVLADSRKLIERPLNPKTDNYTGETRSAEELWENPPNNIIPINFYFEKIPNNMVDKFFFEYGPVKGFRINT
ncbi:MAG: hypothetical protein K9I94_09280 [Bacteroidales bacterium]|nr:hypothetical protein [Bacteroidales bacterium]